MQMLGGHKLRAFTPSDEQEWKCIFFIPFVSLACSRRSLSLADLFTSELTIGQDTLTAKDSEMVGSLSLM